MQTELGFSRVLAFAFAASFCAGEASAQVTNCMAMGSNMVNCNTMGNDGSMGTTNCMDMGGGMATCNTTRMSSGMQAPDPPSQGRGVANNFASFITRMKDNSVRKHVGELLAAGDCQGAGRYAASKGRLELADEVLRSCQAYAALMTRRAQVTAPSVDLPRMVGLTAAGMTMPSVLDEATTLVRAEPMGSQLLLTARANSPLALTTDEGRRRAINTTCANPAFLTLLHYGASVRIVYLDRHKRDIGAVIVTRQICGFS